MDKKQLLRADVQEFIKAHEFSDLSTLLLQRDKYPDLPLSEIADQIKARKKAKDKLPTWYNTAGTLYPKPVSIEQASSEITADWKANNIGLGRSGIDLTGGFGVDSYYFARKFEHWIHVEPNAHLHEVARHNANLLRVSNTEFYNLSSEDFLNQLTQPVDFIYLDPDRRPSEKRVAGFKDSLPDLTELLPRLKEVTPEVLVKASPMIDISAGLADLEAVKQVIVLGVNNEVKELLFLLDFRNAVRLKIRCFNMNKENIETFEFLYNNESQEVIKISPLASYLFEPNATIMKAGGQDILASRHGLGKLHHNTNLYTFEQPLADYPGRVFKVLANLPYKKKIVTEFLKENKANLSTRNFIDSPEQMKKKLGVKDGGELYVFGYRDLENKNRVAVCERMKNSAV